MHSYADMVLGIFQRFQNKFFSKELWKTAIMYQLSYFDNIRLNVYIFSVDKIKKFIKGFSQQNTYFATSCKCLCTHFGHRSKTKMSLNILLRIIKYNSKFPDHLVFYRLWFLSLFRILLAWKDRSRILRRLHILFVIQVAEVGVHG